MEQKIEWVSEDPKEPGWYATGHSWDSNEGTFPDAHYWDGKWMDTSGPFGTATNRPIHVCSNVKFDDPQKAEDWAYDNAPEWW